MGKILSSQAKWILVALIAIGGLAALLGAASQAIWTDTDAIGTNDFTTGTLILNVSPGSALVTFTASPMAPGDSDPVTGGNTLTVSNTGTLELRYAGEVTVSPVNALQSELQLTIRLDDSTVGGDATPADSCDEFDGTIVYASDLATGDGIDEVLFGSNVAGADAGDRVLAGSTSEDLCFRVDLPIGASSAAQGLSTTATFTFYSEQTANNP